MQDLGGDDNNRTPVVLRTLGIAGLLEDLIINRTKTLGNNN
jgi:hypothetical protein